MGPHPNDDRLYVVAGRNSGGITGPAAGIQVTVPAGGRRSRERSLLALDGDKGTWGSAILRAGSVLPDGADSVAALAILVSGTADDHPLAELGRCLVCRGEGSGGTR